MRSNRLALFAAVCLPSVTAGGQTIALSSGHPETAGGFGTVVVAVPDTNGDGVADVVVSAYNQKVGDLLHSGRVTIHSGATGAVLKVLVSPGKQTWGWFGSAISGVPDVTGDNRGDVLIGASNENNGGTPGSGTGRAYLFFNGATGKWVRTIASPNAEVGGSFGGSVAGLGDITGDGKPDLVVGASGEDAGGISRAGRAHLFNPFTGQVLRTLTPSKPEAAGGFGASVGGVPDADGDNRGDVIVGALFEDGGGVFNAGRTYLFSGASGALLRSLVLGAPSSGDYFGASVAGVPDINGDGRGDVIIGASGADPGAAPADSGRAYIYSGATGAFLRGLASPNPEAQAGFGSSVAGLPDGNNNGKGEVVVGVPREDTQIDDVGRVYLFRN